MKKILKHDVNSGLERSKLGQKLFACVEIYHFRLGYLGVKQMTHISDKSDVWKGETPSQTCLTRAYYSRVEGVFKYHLITSDATEGRCGRVIV